MSVPRWARTWTSNIRSNHNTASRNPAPAVTNAVTASPRQGRRQSKARQRSTAWRSAAWSVRTARGLEVRAGSNGGLCRRFGGHRHVLGELGQDRDATGVLLEVAVQRVGVRGSVGSGQREQGVVDET